MSSRGRPEQILQTRIVARLRRDFCCLPVAVPNGGKRGKLEAIRLKEMGVVAGHPDLIVYGREGRCFLMEVKVPGETLSESQRRVTPDLEERGFTVFVVDTIEDAVDAARRFGLGPRPKAAAPLTDAGGF